MDLTFLLLFSGLAILSAFFSSKLVSLIKSPLIVGYIIAGAILGPAVLNVINTSEINHLEIVNVVTLSFIGFGVGGELRFTELKKLGKSIIVIVLMEATAAFLCVGIFCALVLNSIPLGLIYGALAAATAPAGTTDVINQYKAKGNLTTTLYAVMGLDDIYALIIYSLAIPMSIIMLGGSGADVSVGAALGKAGLEVLEALGVGVLMGFIFSLGARRIHDHVSILLFSLGLILLNCGIAEKFDLSPILLNMATGIVLVNRSAINARKVFNSLGQWTPPIYLFFFLLIGTRLDFNLIYQYHLLIFVYIITRSLGKWSGAFTGSALTKAPANTRKYLGFTLLSQAGVAIGLALSAAQSLRVLSYSHEADQIMGVMAATTFLIMLFGPIITKIALVKAGEIREP
ncbi:MAG: cation:proton antiporter [Candidatus Cloacimonetes bacterium]|nr:cation:proton antiporter [Candidatus Cloacimonadota bacterium]